MSSNQRNNNSKKTVPSSKKAAAKRGKKILKVVNGINARDRYMEQTLKKSASLQQAVRSGRQANSSASQKYALSIMLPSQVNHVRFPTSDIERTSLSTLIDRSSVTTVTGDPAANWSPGDTLVAFYGQPARTMLVYTQLTVGVYVPQFVGNGATWPLYNGLKAIGGDERTMEFWPIYGCTKLSGSPPHGLSLPIGKQLGTGFVFLNATDGIEVISVSRLNDLTGDLTFSVYSFSGVGSPIYEEDTFVISVLAGTATGLGFVYIASTPGYYALAYNGCNYTSGTTLTGPYLALEVNCAATVGWKMYHHSTIDPAYPAGSILPLLRCRPNASSLLLSNVSSVLNKQGSVVAARIRATDPFQLTPSALSTAAENYVGIAENGVYTYKQYSEYGSHFRVCAVVPDNIGNGLTSGLCFDLDYDDYYHFIWLSSNVSTPNTFNLQYTTTIEYCSENSLFEKGDPRGSANDLIAARMLVSSDSTWFYENPLHLSDIFNFVKSAGKQVFSGIQRIAPTLANVGSSLMPQYAGPLQGLSSALRAFRL